MKTKIFLLLIPLFLWITFWKWVEDCTPKKFVVSWYYSPKKGQSFYYRWNYDAEVKLNWWWIRWASWKKVFNWMIAAPKNYKFWTYIYFPWYWVWEVSDRWWAIVNAWVRGHAYDRIDVWMWEWEEGLKRALSFWKKELSWYLCTKTEKTVWFDYSKFPILANFFVKSIWSTNLSKWRTDKRVSTLQRYLNVIWYLDEENITWTFWEMTKKSLCKYQVDSWITSAKDEACWTFGPKTRNYMKDQLAKLKSKRLKEIQTQEPDNEKFDQNIAAMSKKQEIVVVEEKKTLFTRWFSLGEKSWEVSLLQKELQKIGFYKWKVTWIFDNATAQAIYDFQLKYQLVGPEDKLAMWYLWPKTREKLNEIINA